MKRILIILISSLAVIFTRCDNAEEEFSFNEQQLQFLSKADTIPEQKLIAKYFENKSLMVLVSEDSIANKLIKIIFSSSSPVIADSLIRTGKDVYQSKLFPFTYRLVDCQVLQTTTMKGVHPSSNWQGQTPGEKEVTYTFKNIK